MRRYTAVVPMLGDTIEHTLAMAKDLIETVMRGLGEEVPVEAGPPIVAWVDAAVPDLASA